MTCWSKCKKNRSITCLNLTQFVYMEDVPYLSCVSKVIQQLLINTCSIGAQTKGCRYDKKPQYRYSSCHGYDVSAFNIVLGIHYQFNSTPYVIQENADDFFVKVSTSEAQKTLQNLILNITDTPAIT